MVKRAFTIIELLVAMALVVVLLAVSAVVFKMAVQAQRAAAATAEIMQKYHALTCQLKTDLSGLPKGTEFAEFAMVWAPGPALNPDGSILDENGDTVPDRYLSFDRLYFFATGSFQSYDLQPYVSPPPDSAIIHSNLARICYSFGRDAKDRRAHHEPDPRKRMLCRTQHLLTSDGNLQTFPDCSSAWNQSDINVFETLNFSLEYQTMPLDVWLNLDLNDYKREILAKVLDLRVSDSIAWQGGPKIDFSAPQQTADTIHQLLCKGVGQFHVQIWDSGYQRWWPEVDPDFNGNYSDADTQRSSLDEQRMQNAGVNYPGGYILAGNVLDTNNFRGYYLNQNQAGFDAVVGSALKFTFTLYDSRGVFPAGKTFTYIVYLNP